MRPLYLLALCLLAACDSAPVTGRSQMMLVSESEERQLGAQAYRQVLASEPQSHDAEFKALVDKVGRRIAQAAAATAGPQFTARVNDGCRHCPIRPICPAHTGGSGA